MTADDGMEDSSIEKVTEELSPSLLKLLEALNLVATEGSNATDEDGTPVSLQVIQSGALSISKTWGKKLTAVGYVGALTAVIGPFLTVIKGYETELQVTLIGGGLFLLASAVVSAALIVSADTRSRATASAARIRGLGEVASAFLAAYGLARDDSPSSTTADASNREFEVLAAAAAFPGRLMISDSEDDPTDLVLGIRNWRGGVNLVLAEGKLVRLGDVRWYEVTPPVNTSS